MNQPEIDFQFSPESGTLRVFSPQSQWLAGGETSLLIQYEAENRKGAYSPTDFLSIRVEQEEVDGITDSAETTVFEAGNNNCEIKARLFLAKDIQRKFIAYKLQIQNQNPFDLLIHHITLFDNTQDSPMMESDFHFSKTNGKPDLAFFSNGWQSWSYSGTYGAHEKQRKTWLQFIPNAASSYPLTPYWMKRGHFSSDFFGIIGDRASRLGLLFGFLSQKKHFGSITAHLQSRASLKMWANGDETLLRPGEKMETDWAVVCWVDLDAHEPLQPFFDLVRRVNCLEIREKIPTGWCSWYHFYTKISEEKIADNLEALCALRNVLPLDLVQIDDGYQTDGGDWFSFIPAFPDGITPLAQKIREKQMTPGLWMAPFIVSNGARLLQTHPEFILRRSNGKAVSSGLISDKFSVALDLSYQPALDYACKVVRTAAQEWGFSYLKLDFLYAGALPGKRFDPYRTRAQVLRCALEEVRNSAGKDTYLLGCGVPLGSALGLFDAMRIGADTGSAWKPKLFNIPWIFKNDPQLPSLSNALQNTITRSAMHLNLWVNDPDCLLVRPQTELTLEEIRTQATAVALTGGSLLLSDDFPKLPAERLRIAEALLPLIGKRAQVLDWFDELTPRHLRLDVSNGFENWHLLALFNWQDKPLDTEMTCQAYKLPQEKYWTRSFWDETARLVELEGPLWKGGIAAHGVVLLAVRKYSDQAQYLGSNLHISQGMEISDLSVNSNRVRCQVDLGRNASGYLELYLPSAPSETRFEGERVAWENRFGSVFRFSINIQQRGVLEIDL